MSFNPVTEKFAENLIRFRRRTNFSQEALGYAADLHRTEVGQLELGNREPKISTVLKLCGTLDVTPTELLEGIQWNPGSKYEGGKLVIKD